jgi:hypothetical protein
MPLAAGHAICDDIRGGMSVGTLKMPNLGFDD